MALLEAAAASLPTVATDVAGNAEIVVDGRTGFLAPAGDPRALAACMERMMRLTDAQRAAIGEAARAHVAAGYGLRHVADRWEAIYERVMAPHRGRPLAARQLLRPIPRHAARDPVLNDVVGSYPGARAPSKLSLAMGSPWARSGWNVGSTRCPDAA